MISLFTTSVRILLFAGLLLLGIQVPGFIIQYAQRVDAHYREVSINVSGFQTTAELLFGGDLQALIDYYASSNDAVFERDANSIRTIVDRYYRISAEQAAMQQDLLAVALHVLLAPDPELFDETMAQYSYNVPLNGLALQWGFGLAIVLLLSLEGVLFGCRKCVGLVRHRHHRKAVKS